MRAREVALCTLALCLAACAAPKRGRDGEQCELNSQCAAPLVCRLGACRNECNTERDCPAGRACVVDESRLGVCQTLAETHCALASDCAAPLVCRASRCVNACMVDRDCPAGSRCMDVAGGRGCIDTSNGMPCVRDSECAGLSDGGHYVCAYDSRCHLECLSDRDCRFGTACDVVQHACVDPRMLPDLGPPDAGVDGSAGDGSVDGGGGDAGDAGARCLDPARFGTAGIFAGKNVTCMTLSGPIPYASIQCWGDNARGQLGDPSVGASSWSPNIVAGLSGLTRVAVGLGDHVCASDGTTAWCWGANDLGQLGDGTTTDRATPTVVSGLTNVREIAVGTSSTCAIADPMQTLYCWGDATNGALGDGRSTGTSLTPQVVPGMTGMIDLSVGVRSACATDTTYQVYCWGENGGGVVGDASTTPRLVAYHPPALVGSFGGPSLGSESACATQFSHQLFCWGTGSQGELGVAPSTTPVAPSSVPFPFLGAVRATYVGDRFACAILTAGGSICWGLNDRGQLGDGTTVTMRATISATDVIPGGAYQLNVGATHACQMASAVGPVECWGSNDFGELGTDPATTPQSNVPVRAHCAP